jgi:hypothetical protein
MMDKITEFGFSWGPMEVQRAVHDKKRDVRIIQVITPRHPEGLQIYVTKTGKIRVFVKNGELINRGPKVRPLR